MSRLSPKPIIARVLQTWDVPPGMKIALVEDMEQRVWVVESCPVGTHFWTLAQAQELSQPGRTGHALRAAVHAGHQLLTAVRQSQPAAPTPPSVLPAPQPLRIAARETQEPITARPGFSRPLRRSSERSSVRHNSKVPVCA